jgi:hypothetical protein
LLRACQCLSVLVGPCLVLWPCPWTKRHHYCLGLVPGPPTLLTAIFHPTGISTCCLARRFPTIESCFRALCSDSAKDGDRHWGDSHFRALVGWPRSRFSFHGPRATAPNGGPGLATDMTTSRRLCVSPFPFHHQRLSTILRWRLKDERYEDATGKDSEWSNSSSLICPMPPNRDLLAAASAAASARRHTGSFFGGS